MFKMIVLISASGVTITNNHKNFVKSRHIETLFVPCLILFVIGLRIRKGFVLVSVLAKSSLAILPLLDCFKNLKISSNS